AAWRHQAVANTALYVQDLAKQNGTLVAFNKVSFSVQRGEIFGSLGPNGAGKTTTPANLEGLRRTAEGDACVAVVDVFANPSGVRSKIGVQLQEAGFFESLTVAETLSTFATFHHKARPIRPLMEGLDLTSKANALVKTLSGGQRQRLSIALALLNDPEIVFLDEPTTGLDPQARRNLSDVIRRIRDEGRTVMLTTHYMDEAEQLCDRIAIIDHGEVIALDTPHQLIRAYAPETKVHLGIAGNAASFPWLRELPAVERIDENSDGLVLHTTVPEELLPPLFDRLRAHGLGFGGIRIDGGTLEDVFLNMTGRRLRE